MGGEDLGNVDVGRGVDAGWVEADVAEKEENRGVETKGFTRFEKRETDAFADEYGHDSCKTNYSGVY